MLEKKKTSFRFFLLVMKKKKLHSALLVSVCVFQVMPPQYLEQNDESASGSVPQTPINHGSDLSTSSTLKGAQFDPSTVVFSTRQAAAAGLKKADFHSWISPAERGFVLHVYVCSSELSCCVHVHRFK